MNPITLNHEQVEAINSLGGYDKVASLVQAYCNEDAVYLDTQVTKAGRIRVPRGPVKKKAPVIKMVDAVVGEGMYMRPNGELYHARDWGKHQDVQALRTARSATTASLLAGRGSSMFALLYGAPGCGKTALVEAAFAGENGSGIYTLLGNGDVEVADMLGGFVQNEAGGFDWIDGDLVKAAEEGAVYFIDEIGLIDTKVLSALYGLMDGRREITINMNPARGKIKAHPDFFVVAATNPNAPGVRLSEALLSRFTVQAEMSTDWSLAKKLGVPATMVTVAQNLAKKQASSEVMWSPQMRELLAFRDISEAFGTEFAIANLIAAAPEMDRPVVSDVLSRAYGEEYKPARI